MYWPCGCRNCICDHIWMNLTPWLRQSFILSVLLSPPRASHAQCDVPLSFCIDPTWRGLEGFFPSLIRIRFFLFKKRNKTRAPELPPLSRSSVMSLMFSLPWHRCVDDDDYNRDKGSAFSSCQLSSLPVSGRPWRLFPLSLLSDIFLNFFSYFV